MAEVRQATLDDAPAIGQVRAETWRAAYRGIVPDKFLDAIDSVRWGERQRDMMLDAPEGYINMVAETEGKVVGWAAGGFNREGDTRCRGELYALYILPEWQRRGIGFKLTLAVAQHLQFLDINSMIVWALEANLPARRFYEALGGIPGRERLAVVGGVRLSEVSFGWDDVSSITGNRARSPAS